MPRLSEWAGGRAGGRVDEWVDYVSMDVCMSACVCECECMQHPQAHSRRQRNGQVEARRHEWMDCVGKMGGVRHLRFKPCRISGRGRRGWLSAFTPNAALLEFQGCRPFWRFPKTGRLPDRRREGTCLRAMQVTDDALQPRTPIAEAGLDKKRLYIACRHVVPTRQRLGGEPGPLGTWALDRTG